MRKVDNNKPLSKIESIPVPGIKVADEPDRMGEVALRVKNLSKSFGGQMVLDDIDFEIFVGDVVLLRGNNGSGKTTLINILTGNLEPDSGTIEILNNGISEYFHFPRKWWKQLNPFDHFMPERVASEGVGRTWQDIRLFSSQNLQDNISLATPGQLGENPLCTVFRRAKVREQEKKINSISKNILVELGLKGREQSSADMISLGQSKRVEIGRAIQAGARILFLDEPLSGLDGEGISEVLDFLREIAREKKVTLVIVEHIFNIPKVIDMVTRVWTLKDKKLTVEDPTNLKEKIKSKSVDDIKDVIEKIMISRFEINEKKLEGGAVLSTVIPTGNQPDKPVLEIENLVVHRGNRLVIGKKQDENLVGISLKLSKGQLAVLQAPNGWGKTTLLEAISGLLPVTKGTIQLNGTYIQNSDPCENSRLGVSFLQARNNTFPGLSVREMLRFANVTKIPGNIETLIKKQVSDLSGGEKQKLAVACTFCGSAFTVGMLDEPFSALDSSELENLYTLIIKLLKKSALLLVMPKSNV